jgi:hypothetical protein
VRGGARKGGDQPPSTGNASQIEQRDFESEIAKVRLRLTDGTNDLENIDIQKAEYSDDEDEIGFAPKELIEHLFKIEENNLFSINEVQNDETELYDLKQSSKKRIDEMRQDLDTKEANIENLKQQRLILD